MGEKYKRTLITYFFDRRNSMEYWLPIMRKSDVKIPKTKFFDIPNNNPDNVDIQGIINFAKSNEMDRLFIRSMYKSSVLSLQKGSIIWEINKSHIYSTINSLIKQHQNNMARVPTGEKLAVREYIDCSYCPYYHDTKVKHTHPTEVRFFIHKGEILYTHPTVDQLRRKNVDMKCTYSSVKDMIRNVDKEKVEKKALKVAQEFKNESWSLDFLLSNSGEWYPIDMGLNGLYYNKKKKRWNNISGHKDDSEYNLMKKYNNEIPDKYKEYNRFPE